MRHRQQAGVTLIELLITVAILAIGVLAGLGSIRYVSTSIQHSKARTLANNLAQEQIEKLKNLSYYLLLVTTSTASDVHFNPSLTYDNVNYPLQTVVEGGVTLYRGTRVDFAYQNGTSITTTTWTSNDTGLKKITTYIIWQEDGNWKYQELYNLMSNPAANPLNAGFSGTVNDSSGTHIAGALVQVLENTAWYGITNAAGYYQFNVSQGSYTLQASSTGYFSQTTNYQSVTSGQSLSVNFSLTAMASGTAQGYVYKDDHLVISQVVASTDSPTVEYVELYNPTSAPINISGSPTNNIDVISWDRNNTATLLPITTFVSTYVAVNHYYLVANAATVHAGGVTRTTDAIYSGSYIGLGIGKAGGITIAYTSLDSPVGTTNARIDGLGWAKNAGSPESAPASATEGTGILANPGSNGIQIGEQFVRMTDPVTGNTSYGRAFDSNDNSVDFFDNATVTLAPNNSTVLSTPIAGTPAMGANVNFDDALSKTTACTSTLLVGGQTVCWFSIPGIATGTWTMSSSSGTYFQQVSSVSIQAQTITSVPNAATNPAYVLNGAYDTLLNTTTDYAFIAGYVYDAVGAPLNNIQIAASGKNTNTSSVGWYWLAVPSGTVSVVANPNNVNRSYTSGSLSLTANPGTLYDNEDFNLSLGGILRGYFQTSSNTPLPGRSAVALVSGNQVAQAVSDNTGYFYLLNLSTGTYTVQPALDPAETASPTSVTVTLSSTGTATAVSTFTIVSALGQITGQTRLVTTPITTGVVILASTSTLASVTSPPSLVGATGVLCNPCYYATTSDSTGDYTLYVRSSALPYNVYGWYTTFNGTTPSTTATGPYSVTVSTGQIISQDLTW